MSIKNDLWIRNMSLEHGMIDPFDEGEKKPGQISSGLSSFGYDIRLAKKALRISSERASRVFQSDLESRDRSVIDPKSMEDDLFEEFEVESHEPIEVPPGSFILGYSVERFMLPENVVGICNGKSSLARCGINVPICPLEPCVDEDTEVLTAEGWRNIAGIRVGDLVLTRRPDGRSEYQPVSRKQAHEYRGSMVHFNLRSVDHLVTPDHKLFVWKRQDHLGTREAKTIEAHFVASRYQYAFDRVVDWRPDESPEETVNINGCELPLDYFLLFLGCWLGDGSAYRASDGGYMIKLAAVTKERKIKLFEQALRGMGIENFRRAERGLQFYNKPLAQYLMQFGHAKDKFIDRQWLDLPSSKLQILLEGLMGSDGCELTETYSTTSKQLADDVQEVIFKTGSAAIVRCEDEVDEHRNPGYRVRISRENMTPKITPERVTWPWYEGMVYDITVPNHVFFCRRNGKALWTGNCWEGHLTIEIFNAAPMPVRVYAMEGIAQVMFFEGEAPVRSYAAKNGKYQGQAAEVVRARVD